MSQCAQREIKEETGLIATSLRIGPFTEDLIVEKHYITIFVIVEKFEGQLELLEPHKCEGWHWFEIDHLPENLFLPIKTLLKEQGLRKTIENSLKDKKQK